MDESQNIEYKAIWKDEYYKWICGFANANGGRIFSSLSDYLVITGTRGKGTYYSIKGLSIGSQLAQK